MNCKQVESRLIDYLDGRLARQEREAVEFHARSCSSCEERIVGLNDVFTLLDSWNGISPSSAFNDRLEQRLEAEASKMGWWGRLFPRLLPVPVGNPTFAVVLFAVVSLAAILIRYAPTPSEKVADAPREPYVASVAAGVDDLTLYRKLPVLEDLDVLRNFEVLQELGGTKSLEQ